MVFHYELIGAFQPTMLTVVVTIRTLTFNMSVEILPQEVTDSVLTILTYIRAKKQNKLTLGHMFL